MILGAVFSVELIAATLWLDGSVLAGRAGLAALIGGWGAWALRALVAVAVFLPAFVWLKHPQVPSGEFPVRWRLLFAHLAAISLFVLLSVPLYGGGASNALAAAWLLTGIAAIVCAALALIPLDLWIRFARASGPVGAIVAAAVAVACVAGNSGRGLWPWASGITFRLTAAILRLFVSGLIVEPDQMIIGTSRFQVEVAPQCSGLEGVGLMLAFGGAWLFLFRKQCRFPQALLLLPVGALLIFLLNAVRIAALVLIGNAGAERIAAGGFHSQAGWILFNVVGVGFILGSAQLSWVSKTVSQTAGAEKTENSAAPWLAPLIAILAAGMVSHALSGGFEWAYPLRLVAGAAALFAFRRVYAEWDWRFDWTGPAIGVAVFVLWMGMDRVFSPGVIAMPSGLASASPGVRGIWIAARAAAAILTVPVAEELAYRGFLYRRVISADFEAVPMRRFSWLALLVSSVAFGIPHGSRWLAGAVAGALYAIAMMRRGRIGNAIAAHAVTNALVAADVLLFGNWALW